MVAHMIAYFCYERGPTGWVPKIHWNEKPPEVKRGKDDIPFRTELIDVTHIARLYKAENGVHLMNELTETYPAPKEKDIG